MKGESFGSAKLGMSFWRVLEDSDRAIRSNLFEAKRISASIPRAIIVNLGMAISTNSVFHFTKKEELLEILKEEFKVYYCNENCDTKRGGGFNLVIPMVCFSDMPLSQIKDHIKKYGNYGIGLKKSWAKAKELNPVLYVEKNATPLKNLIQAHVGVDMSSGNQQIRSNIDEVLCYIKNYEGVLMRKGEVVDKNYRFYDEREWRYVPSPSDAQLIISPADYITSEQKDVVNNRIRNLRLGFEPDDITYIIIEDENEIDDFIRAIEDAKSKYSETEKKKLLTRIITTKQILSDF